MNVLEKFTEELTKVVKANTLVVEQLTAKNKLTKGLILMALDELGIPTKDYPAPVANAVDFLKEALKV